MDELILTDIGTIKSENFKEIFFSKFLDTIEKNWGLCYSIAKLEKDDEFIVMYKYQNYILKLNKNNINYKYTINSINELY